MENNIILTRLDFFRLFEMIHPNPFVNPERIDGYYVLGEYDYFHLTVVEDAPPPPLFDNYKESLPRPASSVLANWVPSDTSSRTGADLRRYIHTWSTEAETGFLCRVDLGNPNEQLNKITTLEDIKTHQRNYPPEKATHLVENQLHFIDEVYKAFSKWKVTCFQSISAYSVYVLIAASSEGLKDALRDIKTISYGSNCTVVATTTIALVRADFAQSLSNDPSRNSHLPRSESWSAQLLISCPGLTDRRLFTLLVPILTRCGIAESQYTIVNSLGDFDYSVRVCKVTLQELANISLLLHRVDGLHAKTSLEWPRPHPVNDVTTEPEPNDVGAIASPLNGLHELIKHVPTNDLSPQEHSALRKWQREFHWIVAHVESALGDPTMRWHILDLLAVLVQRVLNLLVTWGKNPNSLLNFDTTLNILTAAITQRKQPRLLPSLEYPLAETTLAQGSHLVIRSITRYINALFIHAGRLLPGMLDRNASPPYWQAVVVFDYEDGFICYPNHLFSIPFEAAFKPLSAAYAWQTLSHEVAHAIYADLRLHAIAEASIIDLIKTIKPADSSFFDERQIVSVLKSDCREVVAHWLDANLFHFRDVESYLLSIWATWERRVEGQPIPHVKAYLVRSFIVWMALCDRRDDIFQFVNELHAVPVSNWDGYVKSILERFSGHFDDFVGVMKRAAPFLPRSAFAEIADQVLVEAAWQLTILWQLRRLLPALENIPNATLGESDADVFNRLLAGKIVTSPVESPVGLVQQLNKLAMKAYRRIGDNPGYASDRAEVALMMVLADCEFFAEGK